MCGRYASSRRPEDLAEMFGVEHVDDLDVDDVGPGTGGVGGGGRLPPSWNVAPTDPVYAVLDRARRDQPGAVAVRRLTVVRWGLVPSWAAGPAIGSRLINARVETVAVKPAFRRAFAARRCLLPADGYYEWQPQPGGGKIPYFLRPRGGGVLAMAGLYERWPDPSRDRDDPGAWWWTATIITTRATDEFGQLHDRMPMLVRAEDYDAWLDPTLADPSMLRGLLAPAAPGWLEAHPVSPAVGNVRNNGPHLTGPVPPPADPLRRE